MTHRNFLIITEYGKLHTLDDCPWVDELADKPIEISDGYLEIPPEAGLSIGNKQKRIKKDSYGI